MAGLSLGRVDEDEDEDVDVDSQFAGLEAGSTWWRYNGKLFLVSTDGPWAMGYGMCDGGLGMEIGNRNQPTVLGMEMNAGARVKWGRRVVRGGIARRSL